MTDDEPDKWAFDPAAWLRSDEGVRALLALLDYPDYRIPAPMTERQEALAKIAREGQQAEHDRAIRAAAWDEGHLAEQRLGPDDCECGAWCDAECGCGMYGTGAALSLADNPYRPLSTTGKESCPAQGLD